MSELGLEFVKWVQEHRTRGGEAFFLQVTEMGEWAWLFGTLGVLFWAFGARIGYRVGLGMMLGDMLAGVAKNVVCLPRPWLRDPGIVPMPEAKWGAFGYSFPSGHASSSALLWGGVAGASGRGWAWVPALAWIGLVGFSRVYLGVHTMVDVAAAWALAVPAVWAAGWTFAWIERNPERAWRAWAALAVATIAVGVVLRLLPAPEDAGDSFGRDGYRAMVSLLAFLAAWGAERKWVRYDPARLGAYRIVAVAAGLVVLLLILSHLRLLLAPWLGSNGALYGVAAAIPLWIFLAWPALLKPLESAEG
jgi:membrane-associated phospholipid phosphatase